MASIKRSPTFWSNDTGRFQPGRLKLHRVFEAMGKRRRNISVDQISTVLHEIMYLSKSEPLLKPLNLFFFKRKPRDIQKGSEFSDYTDIYHVSSTTNFCMLMSLSRSIR